MKIADELASIQAEHGPWTAHNLEICPGLFTISPDAYDRVQQRAALYAGLCGTLLSRKIEGLKVLDLGCLEGGISIELARRGAFCTGLDVRPAHLAKASFAARVLNLEHSCLWIVGDVTDSEPWQDLGEFDLVICSGLLYHLDATAIMPLIQNLHKVCRKNGMALIDTNISPSPQVCVKLPNQPPLWGCNWHEHDALVNPKQRMAASWSSYRNNQAFWLTERSLTNALVSGGFGAVFKPLFPYHEWGHQTRDVWIALPGPANPPGLPLRPDPDPRPWAHPGLP